MICQKCGTKLDADDEFCPDCGAKISGATTKQEPVYPSPNYVARSKRHRFFWFLMTVVIIVVLIRAYASYSSSIEPQAPSYDYEQTKAQETSPSDRILSIETPSPRVNPIPEPLPKEVAKCGNGIAEDGENCENCKYDAMCEKDEACIKQMCIPNYPYSEPNGIIDQDKYDQCSGVAAKIIDVCEMTGWSAYDYFTVMNVGSIPIYGFNAIYYTTAAGKDEARLFEPLDVGASYQYYSYYGGIRMIELVPIIFANGEEISCNNNAVSYGDVYGTGFPAC